jgi:GTP cyclohydrolase I
MYVDLPHHFKGTHMSRFIEVLNQFRREITIRNIWQILEEMKTRLNATCAHMELRFPYFIEKQAPVSRARGLMEYQCRLRGVLGAKKEFFLAITIPVTTLCPCSREISRRGAHNQRSEVQVEIKARKLVWIEDLIAWVEDCASSPVFSLLKREDEKAVTERAYDNPMFVEDVVRAVTEKLQDVPEILGFRVECENFESIHNHSAYAMVERGDI